MEEEKIKIIGKVRYVGPTTECQQLIDNKVYDVIRVSSSYFKIIDNDGEETYFPISRPCELLNPTIYGKWEVIDDPYNVINKAVDYYTSIEESKHI